MTEPEYLRDSSRDRRPPYSEDAEQAVLAACLFEPQALLATVALLDPPMFYAERHRRIFGAMQALLSAGSIIDPLTLANELARKGELESAGGKEYLGFLVDAVPTAANVTHHAGIVREKAQLRRLIELAHGIESGAYDGSILAQALARNASQALLPLSIDDATAPGFRVVKDSVWPVLDEIDARARGKIGGLMTHYQRIDAESGGFQEGEFIVLGGAEGMGKAQPLTARVRTPSGWSTIGGLQVGDALASHDGGASRVTRITPQGSREVWRVTFSDGTSARCCADHLWQVERHCEGRRPRVLTTLELRDFARRNPKRIVIPIVNGQGVGTWQDVPLHPYMVGALIGISKQDAEMRGRFEAVLPAGMELRDQGSGGRTWAVVQRRNNHRNPAREALTALGLFGCRSEAKFIPRIYLDSSHEQRTQMLQGLLDTDGWVEPSGTVRYCTTSPQLASDLTELVQSLGGLTSVATKLPKFTHAGEQRTGQLAYVITVRGGKWLPPLVTLARHRKQLAYEALRRPNPARVVVSVESEGVFEKMACITVSHPSALYVTDNYIVTHNSAMALNLALRVASEPPVKGGGAAAYVSAEMSREALTRRCLSYFSRIDGRTLRTGQLQNHDFARLATAGGILTNLPLYIDDEAEPTLADVVARCTHLKATHPEIRLIVVDFLQLIHAREKGLTEAIELKRIAYALKGLAKRLKVVVIAPCQINSKEVEDLKDARPRLKDLQGSSGMRQAADFIGLLFRPAVYDSSKDPGELELYFAKARETAPFLAQLRWDGPTLTIMDPIGPRRVP
ncbi:hypothetical protein BH11GEM2_BH11GEM2_38230 [soil metagenome]